MTETEARARWPVQTRREAHLAGAHRYFTGKPCKWAHWCQRAVASGICVDCNRAYAAKYKPGTQTVAVALTVHPEDAEAVRAYAAALNAARDAAAPAFDPVAARAALYPGVTLAADAPKMTPR